MSRPALIAIIGIDGSGKTTTAKALVRHLRGRGLRARYFENAGGRPPLNWLARSMGHADAVDWLGAERLQAIEQRVRHVLMRVAAAWSRGPGERTAVLDRWAVCQYAVVRARRSSGETQARVRYAGLPEPDLVVFLDVSPVVARERLERRGKDVDELEWLERADAAYRSLPEWEQFTRVDGDRPTIEIVADVAALVRPGGPGGPATARR